MPYAPHKSDTTLLSALLAPGAGLADVPAWSPCHIPTQRMPDRRAARLQVLVGRAVAPEVRLRRTLALWRLWSFDPLLSPGGHIPPELPTGRTSTFAQVTQVVPAGPIPGTVLIPGQPGQLYQTPQAPLIDTQVDRYDTSGGAYVRLRRFTVGGTTYLEALEDGQGADVYSAPTTQVGVGLNDALTLRQGILWGTSGYIPQSAPVWTAIPYSEFLAATDGTPADYAYWVSLNSHVDVDILEIDSRVADSGLFVPPEQFPPIAAARRSYDPTLRVAACLVIAASDL